MVLYCVALAFALLCLAKAMIRCSAVPRCLLLMASVGLFFTAFSTRDVATAYFCQGLFFALGAGCFIFVRYKKLQDAMIWRWPGW